MTELQYKPYKNKLTDFIRIAKHHYYDQRFDSAENYLNETWKLINEVINKRKCRPPPGNTCFHSFLNDQAYESLVLKPTTVEELNDICMSMKSGIAPGYDDILCTLSKILLK